MTVSRIEKFQNHFLVSSPTETWKELANRVGTFCAKIIFFPYTLVKYSFQRLIMTFLYPAQSRLIKFFARPLSLDVLDETKRDGAAYLSRIDIETRDVIFEKDGIRYHGILMGHKDKIDNGKWIIQATGNCQPIELGFDNYAYHYANAGFNTLMINGPAVGHSEGQSTPDTMGDAQEIGISYLETVVKAKKIILAGFSLGGAAMSQAIKKHTFKKEIEYLAVRQMTFDCASNVCAKVVGKGFPRLEELVRKLVHWACEMDSVAASRKLEELEIQEIIIQASSKSFQEGEVPSRDDFISDGVIAPQASLGAALVQQGVTKNKIFKGIYAGSHNGGASINTTAAIIKDYGREKLPLPVTNSVLEEGAPTSPLSDCFNEQPAPSILVDPHPHSSVTIEPASPHLLSVTIEPAKTWKQWAHSQIRCLAQSLCPKKNEEVC